jgi:pyridoxine 5-phosphate synthase
VDLVLEVVPTQVTLVPDAVDAITSNAGWDTIKHRDYLKDMIHTFKQKGIRTSIFVDPVPAMVEGAAQTGTDRIELYTEQFAVEFKAGKPDGVKPYVQAAEIAEKLDLGVNAGHDLSLDNIAFFSSSIHNLLEVSIGHALISEAIYLGLENVINMYKHRLK